MESVSPYKKKKKKNSLLTKHTDVYFDGNRYKEKTESTLENIVNRINECVNIFRNDISEFKL